MKICPTFDWCLLLVGGVGLSVERHQEVGDAQQLSGAHLLQLLVRLVDALDLQSRAVQQNINNCPKRLDIPLHNFLKKKS